MVRDFLSEAAHHFASNSRASFIPLCLDEELYLGKVVNVKQPCGIDSLVTRLADMLSVEPKACKDFLDK